MATQNHKWIQKDTSIQVTVPVPPSVKKTDCDVKFGRSYLYIGLVGRPALVEVSLCFQFLSSCEEGLNLVFTGKPHPPNSREEVEMETWTRDDYGSFGKTSKREMGRLICLSFSSWYFLFLS